jgi:hypothetical protein
MGGYVVGGSINRIFGVVGQPVCTAAIRIHRIKLLMQLADSVGTRQYSESAVSSHADPLMQWINGLRAHIKGATGVHDSDRIHCAAYMHLNH